MDIAICDDNAQDRAHLEELLHSWGEIPCTVTAYDCGEALLSELNNGVKFDLIFLDIYLKRESGIDVAKAIRQHWMQLPIYFLTVSPDYALEAFGVRASNYLLKPVNRGSVHAALLDCQTVKAPKEQYWLTTTEEGDMRIDIQTLVYCEGQGHYFDIHLQDGTVLSVRMTHAQLGECLAEFGHIVSCGKSFFVNLAYVKVLNKRDLRMTNGKVISVPRGVYKDFREAYFAFYSI